MLALTTTVLFTSEEPRRRPQDQSPVPEDRSPVQESPALGCSCFRDHMDAAAAALLRGNASEPKSKGNGSRNVFITAAATILGTKTEADLISGGGRLFHKLGCRQLSQGYSRSLLTHSNEPICILHCEVLWSVQQTPRPSLRLDHSEAQILGEHTGQEEAGSAGNTMVEKWTLLRRTSPCS